MSIIDSFLGRLKQVTYSGRYGPYMTRYELLNLGKRLVRVKLNYFHRGDEDVELHSHPWEWAISIILKGGYWEERLVGNQLEIRRFSPGDINLFLSNTFHRVIKAEGTWSLFITGPERGTWYFMNHKTRELLDWKTFIQRKGLTPVEA